MCKEESHWCSNCGSKVDSGKTGEYRVINFQIEEKMGKIYSQDRTIICKRCLKNENIKQFLAFTEDLEKISTPEKIKKQKRAVGEIGCSRCGKLLTPEVPTVALSIMWDVNYKKLDVKTHVMCKDCYNTDPKTRAVWQFLATLGKNPTFRPQTIICSSKEKCATYEKGRYPFDCKHIGCGIQEKGGVTTDVLLCTRAHPRKYKFIDQISQRHRNRGPFGKRKSRSMSDKELEKQLKGREERLKKLRKTIKEGIKKTNDPGIEAMLKVSDMAVNEELIFLL